MIHFSKRGSGILGRNQRKSWQDRFQRASGWETWLSYSDQLWRLDQGKPLSEGSPGRCKMAVSSGTWIHRKYERYHIKRTRRATYRWIYGRTAKIYFRLRKNGENKWVKKWQQQTAQKEGFDKSPEVKSCCHFLTYPHTCRKESKSKHDHKHCHKSASAPLRNRALRKYILD